MKEEIKKKTRQNYVKGREKVQQRCDVTLSWLLLLLCSRFLKSKICQSSNSIRSDIHLWGCTLPLNQFTNKHSAAIIHDAGVRDAIPKATQKTRLSESHEVSFIFICLRCWCIILIFFQMTHSWKWISFTQFITTTYLSIYPSYLYICIWNIYTFYHWMTRD